MSGQRGVEFENYDLVVRSLITISAEAENGIRLGLRDAGSDVSKLATSNAPKMPHNLGIGSFGKRRVRSRGGDLHAARQRPNAGSVKYTFKTGQPLTLTIRTPTSAPEARAASIAEFARKAHTPQGAVLIAALNSMGSPGRILWDAWDRRWLFTQSQVQDRLDQAAEKINKVTG